MEIKIKYHAKDEAICSKLRKMAELEAEKSNDIDKMSGKITNFLNNKSKIN